MAVDVWVVTGAALAGSAINSVAGGGTFITFPTLTGAAGLSEKLANVTSTIGLWPGYASSVAAAWRQLSAESRAARWGFGVVGLIGGAVGAVLLQVTSAAVFRLAVPVLLAVATALFAIGPWVQRRLEGRGRGASRGMDWHAWPAVAGAAVYNGYFGAGGGVLAVAAMSTAGIADPRRANALKVLLQLTSNAAAVLVFMTGVVAWRAVPGMWVGSLVGGWLGMRVAQWMPRSLLRAVILGAGVVLTGVYGWRAWGA